VPTSLSSPTTPGAPGKRGGRRWARLVTALFVLLGVLAYGVYQLEFGFPPKPGCMVSAGGQSVKLEPAQAANASTIAAVADSRDLPERALTIALATAIQESGLRNIDHGDRDSLGLFQQRPSQGWGTVPQIMDPVHAANAFFDGLLKIKDYARLPLTEAAQRVQRSGFPEAYAKHETDATLLSSALTGRRSAALTCVTDAARGGTATLVGGDPATIRARLVREFGSRVRPSASPLAAASASVAASGGTGAGPVTHGTAGASAVPAGSGGRETTVRTLSVASAAPDKAGEHGWVLAQWAVAHAQELKIAQVSYRGRLWSAQASVRGWQKSAAKASEASREDVRISVVQ
jgi:hypothetical protein